MNDIRKYLGDLVRQTYQGKTIVPFMKLNNYAYASHPQWHGYYFKEKFNRYLNTLGCKEKTFGNKTIVRIYKNTPLIIKLHSSHTNNKTVPTNDLNAVNEMLMKYNKIIYIIVLHDSILDDDRSFREWQQSLFGGKTSYEKKKDSEGRSRREIAKKEITITDYKLVEINSSNINKHSQIFQKGFINADDKKRKSKLSIKLDKLV